MGKWYSQSDLGAITRGRNFPACELSEAEEKQLNAVVADVLQFYEPKKFERELVGVFGFDNSTRPLHRCALAGIEVDTENHAALIGLERSFLNPEFDDLARILFMHELSHLSCIGHGEEFCDRFNEIILAYWTSKAEAEKERNDDERN